MRRTCPMMSAMRPFVWDTVGALRRIPICTLRTAARSADTVQTVDEGIGPGANPCAAEASKAIILSRGRRTRAVLARE